MNREPNPSSVTAASILTWGLFANPALLYFLGSQFYVLETPWKLALTVLTYALFIGVASVYVPARLAVFTGTEFGEQAESIFGKWPGLLVARALTPLWALSWFALSAGWMSGLLLTELWHGAGLTAESVAAHVIADATTLALTVPFAAQPSLVLASNSRFTVKVAALAVTALTLSTISGVPDTYLWLKENTLETTWLDWHLLLWALPAVMFAVGTLGNLRADKAAVRRYALLGVVLPLVFAAAAGILTLAGAADWGNRMWKIPDYQAVYMRREIKIGWGKGLVMVFTLLTVSRFALHLAAKHAFRHVSLTRCAFLGVATFAIIEAKREWSAIYWCWIYSVLPFVGISGALCAAVVTRTQGQFRVPDQVAASLAIFGGAVSTEALNRWLIVQPTGFVVIAGWLSAFLITLAARLLNRTRRSESAPPPAP